MWPLPSFINDGSGLALTCLTASSNLIPNAVERHNFLKSFFCFVFLKLLKPICKVSKGAKIRNRYNKVPDLTQNTNGKVTNSQLDTTNESQEVSPFPAGDHKAHINRRYQRHSKHKTEQKHKRSTKEVPPWNGQ